MFTVSYFFKSTVVGDMHNCGILLENLTLHKCLIFGSFHSLITRQELHVNHGESIIPYS